VSDLKKDTDFVNILLTSQQRVDEVTLAQGTPFEVTVTRFSQNNGLPQALIFSALIEEILQLKDAVTKLKGSWW